MFHWKKMIAVLCACVLVTACAGAFAEDYTASAPGMGGDVPVTVSYEDGRITAVSVGENSETPGIGDQAINAIPGRIVEEQSLTVDTVAGATVTSNAILTAAEAALTAGGVDVTPFKQEKQPTELVEGEAVETDIVIVGAGISGLMAAYELKEDYPDVSFIVLEKLDMVSGSLPASGGAIAGISSEYHVRDGVECTTKDFDVLFTYTSGTQVRTALVENVYAKSDVLLNRLIDYGTPFTGETEPASTYSDKVYAIRTENRGQSFADFLNSYVKENTFDLRMGTTATELIVEDGKVAGVVAEDDEQRYDIRAKAVILATGGYNHNDALVPLWDNRCEGMPAQGCPTNTGDGLIMAAAAGAAYMSARAEAPTSCLLDMDSVNYASFALPREGAICVGVDGKRFMLESSELKRINTEMAIEQYVNTKELGSDFVAFVCCNCDAIQTTIADGVTVFTDGTLEGLAEQMGVARSELKAAGIDLGDELLSMFVTEKADDTNAAISKIKELFPKAVNAAVQEALKRRPPKDGAGAKPSQSFASKFASDYSNRMNGGKKDGAQ